ncbi:Uncharacterised protein [Vibrio cholerae]|nr:Uncharacterised protein [Vibrio cholerae]
MSRRSITACYCTRLILNTRRYRQCLSPFYPIIPFVYRLILPLALNLNKSGGSYTRCWRMNKAIRLVCNGTFCVWRRMSVIR